MTTRLLARTALALLLCCAAGAGAQAPAGRVADAVHALEGRLTYYAQRLAGRTTASGERFDHDQMTMAHKTLPFGTLVRVVNPANQRSVVVRVNDRGAWAADRIGDVSIAAARELGMLRRGIARVRLEVLGAADGEAADRTAGPR